MFETKTKVKEHYYVTAHCDACDQEMECAFDGAYYIISCAECDFEEEAETFYPHHVLLFDDGEERIIE